MDAQQQILAQIAQLQAQLQVIQNDKGVKWCNLIESFNKDKRNEAVKELGGEIKRPIMSRPIDYIIFARQYVIDMGYVKQKVKSKAKKVSKPKTGPKPNRKTPLTRIRKYEEVYMKEGEVMVQCIPKDKKMKGTKTIKESIIRVEWTGKDWKNVDVPIVRYPSLYKATISNIENACEMDMKDLNELHKKSSKNPKSGPTISPYGEYSACGFAMLSDTTKPIAFRDCVLGEELQGREWDRDNWEKYVDGSRWEDMMKDKEEYFKKDVDDDDEIECEEIEFEDKIYYKDIHGNVYDEEENLVGQWENEKIKFNL